MIVEDTDNFCPRCDLVIDTEDMFEPACNCISEVESLSEKKFQEEWESLPSHIRRYFQPPEPKKE